VNDTMHFPAHSLDIFDYDRDPTVKLPRASKDPKEWQGKRDEGDVLRRCSVSVREDQGLLWVSLLLWVVAATIWGAMLWYGFTHVNEILYVLVLWNRG